MFTQSPLIPFSHRLEKPLTKQPITTLQINLGRKCNLACGHCHVEAGPKRTETLSPEILQQLLTVIRTFSQIETVDLTGGAPEMHDGFRKLVATSRQHNKTVIVRSNLTIFFVPGYEDLPEYFADQKVRVVASLPCYLEDNVDRQRGNGVYQDSIRALQLLNQQGYGQGDLGLDLVYNPPIPVDSHFQLTPHQDGLTAAYRQYLNEHFGIQFNRLLTITNLPIGRTKQTLAQRDLLDPYLQFLSDNHNANTVEHLMCRSQLSVDYLGNIYDCDFNQMEALAAVNPTGQKLTLKDLIIANSLDVITTVKTANYCYGCTAGSGSSCGGALI